MKNEEKVQVIELDLQQLTDLTNHYQILVGIIQELKNKPKSQYLVNLGNEKFVKFTDLIPTL